MTGGDTKGPRPSIPWMDREGGLLVFSCCQKVYQWFFRVVKELNNENRWRMPDRIDRVM